MRGWMGVTTSLMHWHECAITNRAHPSPTFANFHHRYRFHDHDRDRHHDRNRLTDKLLEECGSRRFAKRGECDDAGDDSDKTIATWEKEVFAALQVCARARTKLNSTELKLKSTELN